MRPSYISTLYKLAKDDKNILALVADIGAIIYDKYRKDFPDQFLNAGISEQNITGVAAGLAACGKIPFIYTIAPFITMRNYEQIRNDIALSKSNVKIVGVGAGFRYASQGPTHHAIEDIAIMRVLPNMTIISPADPQEVKKATIAAAEFKGPVYLRLGTTGEPDVYQEDYKFVIGKGIELKKGQNVTIITTGSIVYDALEAAKELEEKDISTRVINIHTIKPIDKKIILKAAKETGVIVTVEEHNIEGGLGGAVAEIILEECDRHIKFKRLGVPDIFCSFYGTHQELKEHYGLAKKDIVREVTKLYNLKKYID